MSEGDGGCPRHCIEGESVPWRSPTVFRRRPGSAGQESGGIGHWLSQVQRTAFCDDPGVAGEHMGEEGLHVLDHVARLILGVLHGDVLRADRNGRSHAGGQGRGARRGIRRLLGTRRVPGPKCSEVPAPYLSSGSGS